MTNGYELGPGVLDGIHKNLNDAHGQVEGLAGSVPQGVDAGDLGGPLNGLLAGFVDNSGQFSTALSDLAQGVEASKKDYDLAEERAQQEMDRAAGGTR